MPAHNLVERVPNTSLQRTRRQSLRSFLLAAELDIVRGRISHLATGSGVQVENFGLQAASRKGHRSPSRAAARFGRARTASVLSRLFASSAQRPIWEAMFGARLASPGVPGRAAAHPA